jgi:type I restriction enzyme M protein
LRNESDVEQFFVVKFLHDLGFTDSMIETKTSIEDVTIGKGKKRKSYRPDYIAFLDKEHKKPVILLDAKHPNEEAEEGVTDSQLYTSVLRRKLESPKPDQFCIGTNGVRLIVKHYDSDVPLHELQFANFEDSDQKYVALKASISFEVLLNQFRTTYDVFEYRKPDVRAIKSIFEACHKLIWKTEKRTPSSAFYEFTKLMFIKLNEDKKLHEKEELKQRIETDQPLPKDEVIFSTHWIRREEKTDPNPVDTILFKNLRLQLEKEISEKKKKRIFDKDEKIDLEPSTIKEVVKLLEHYDLYGIDEDLNGRLFETFLNATMRGQELGQFFTPRTVVKFMTKMAQLKADKDHIDLVLDACCGTGGFLIEAMADMAEKIESNRKLTNKEKSALLDKIKSDCLWGIDAGKSPPIARIARINMFLHRDGGSRIYFADGLDKELMIENGIDDELKRDRQELRDSIVSEQKRFDVILTNPPFAMRYEKKKPHERRILEQYDLQYEDWKNKEKPRTSVKSAVMFLERYFDLLNQNGRLLTIMDESILNTTSNKIFRDYIKDKFIIKAVISLPRNAFVKAESSVKTSVLYLRKKTSPDESQPRVFMAISENVGHNDSGKEMPDLNDLPHILDEFLKFQGS